MLGLLINFLQVVVQNQWSYVQLLPLLFHMEIHVSSRDINIVEVVSILKKEMLQNMDSDMF